MSKEWTTQAEAAAAAAAAAAFEEAVKVAVKAEIVLDRHHCDERIVVDLPNGHEVESSER